MSEEKNLQLLKLDAKYRDFNFDDLSAEDAEMLITIIENEDTSGSGQYQRLVEFAKISCHETDDERIMKSKLNRLRDLGLIWSEFHEVNGRTKLLKIHTSKYLKKELYKRFPEEVATYNEFKKELIAVLTEKDEYSLEGVFSTDLVFKIKKDQKYKIIIKHLDSLEGAEIKIIIEEI